MNKKVIGIIGGMGPLATADLFQKIVLHTEAACDQEHLRVCIDSNTNIADRTAALLHGGANPVPEMVKSAQRLASIGAEVLIMPCNTAHNFYDEVAASVDLPVLQMIALTRDALGKKGVTCAGLLATDGTVQTGIYQRTFAGSGIELLVPEGDDQAAVMDIIYNGVKAGDMNHDVAAFRRTCENLLARGAEVLILGCTELPPAFELYHLDYPNVDPTLELALGAIRFAGGQIKD
ncbi:MAG: amino acid racemase [Eubacteriales bacterium]|nr:amino acid racemase [Eubacteriales bacterium]